MSHRVRWLQELGILVVAITAIALVLTLLVHALLPPPRAARARREQSGEVRRREFRPPQPVRAVPAVLKQIALVAVVAVVGRKVFRIRLGA